MTTYRVTIETGFDGRGHGEEFDADLDPFIEQNAIEQGWIEIVKGTAKTKAVKNDE